MFSIGSLDHMTCWNRQTDSCLKLTNKQTNAAAVVREAAQDRISLLQDETRNTDSVVLIMWTIRRRPASLAAQYDKPDSDAQRVFFPRADEAFLEPHSERVRPKSQFMFAFSPDKDEQTVVFFFFCLFDKQPHLSLIDQSLWPWPDISPRSRRRHKPSEYWVFFVVSFQTTPDCECTAGDVEEIHQQYVDFFFPYKRGKLVSKHSGQLRENQFVQILLFIFFKEELILSRGVTPLGESYERNEICVFVWSRRDALALIAKLQFVSLMIIIIQNT